MSGQVLTAKETQKRLKIGRTKFYKLTQSGELKHFRVGKLIRVREEAIEEFVKTREEGGA